MEKKGSRTQGPFNSSSQKVLANQLSRNAVSYLEKLDRYECQELLAFASSHWLLSNEDFRLPTDPPPGLVSGVNLPNSNMCVVLYPVPPDLPTFDYREFHHLVRELTHGIYVMNQSPSISLEANFDESTSCQIPPAYLDTRIGQILVTVDYLMKCLWHGAYIPKEKRVKFTDRWRNTLDVNQTGKPETKKPLLNEFVVAGLCDITTDPDFADAYCHLPVEQPGDPKVVEERRFFMTHVDDLCMEMHLYQRHVAFHNNLFLVDAHHFVSCCVRLLDDSLERADYERIRSRLQHHERMIMDNLQKKADIRHQLEMLKFISYMTPFLMGIKKRMKIPDTSRLLPNLVGDECRTEREFPPLILGPDFKCKNFLTGQHYFHLHGGIHFDLATEPMSVAHSDMAGLYDQICAESSQHLASLLDTDAPLHDGYHMLTYDINGKKYYAMVLEFETYYSSIPQKPMWVRAFHDEMVKMKPKKLPMSDIHLQEQFKKFFGYKKALKYKIPAVGIKAASQRGLVAVFQALCRKMPGSRTGKPDEAGLSLMHYAAMYNRQEVTAVLLINNADINIRRAQVLGNGVQQDDPNGVTPLHVASRCGSLDVVRCLVGVGANTRAIDPEGWAPIHLAAFYDHQPIIKMLVWKQGNMVELKAQDKLKSTPLLLAASSGALSALKCLICLGASVRCSDTAGNNIVILAALHVHINILLLFIHWNNHSVPVWDIIVDMLSSDDMAHKENAVRCLDILTSARGGRYWEPVLQAGAMPSLIRLLKEDSDQLQSLVTSVLCNISDNHQVQEALTDNEAGPILIQLLDSPVQEIQSRCAIIICDMANIFGNQETIAIVPILYYCTSGISVIRHCQENLAKWGGVVPLARMLDSDLEDILVNATSAIRAVCTGNHDNQTAAVKYGVVRPLVEFLTVASDDLQASTAAALRALGANHTDNQNEIMAKGAAKPLVELLQSSRSITVQVKVVGAVEALVLDNPVSQKYFLQQGAPKALLRLLKSIFTEVREQGANALWALAGDRRTQQKYIAEQVSIPHIIQMLLESTEKLLRVGCMMAIALGLEDQENQIKLGHADAIQQLVRLLRTRKKNDSVMLLVIKVLGILCLGVAYRNNKETQRYIAEEGGIHVLSQIVLEPPSEEVQVAVAKSLACVVLSNRQNQEKLFEELHFHFDIILHLLKSPQQHIRLQAGMALTLFAYNNTPQQLAIREAGGIKYSIFEPFFLSDDEYQQCYSAFQVVVLARVIVDWEQVQLTARGISQLVDKLKSLDDKVLVLACSLLSSLCHTRTGIPDAIVAAEAIHLLVQHLQSPDDQVRNGAAVTLGYLTFNKTAARLLLSICRNYPDCFYRLINNLGLDPHICPIFVKSFKRARKTGLPSQW
ncbi:hypothetical protein ACOMHN_048873 [Nucella lapillus]